MLVVRSIRQPAGIRVDQNKNWEDQEKRADDEGGSPYACRGRSEAVRCDSENSEEQTIGQEQLPTVSVDVVPVTTGFHRLGNANSIHTVHRNHAQHERDRESDRQETNAAVDNNGRYHSKHLNELKGQGSADTTVYTILDLLNMVATLSGISTTSIRNSFSHSFAP